MKLEKLINGIDIIESRGNISIEVTGIQIEKNWETGRQAVMGMMIVEDFPKLNKDPIFSN